MYLINIVSDTMSQSEANPPGTFIYGLGTVQGVEPGLLPPTADKQKQHTNRRISDVVSGFNRISNASFNKVMTG